MLRFIGLASVLVWVAGCSQQPAKQTADPSVSTTPVAFNATGAPTVQISVPDMMCPEGCGETVKEILAGQPGAKDVQIDFESKTVTVAIDKEKFDSGQAIAALKDRQFGKSALKDASAAPPVAAPAGAESKSVQ